MLPGRSGSVFADTYKGRRVLLTGHTGFKGSWLALWLKQLGAEVTGISLPAETSPSHWDLLSLDMRGHYQDIRDAEALARIVKQARPEIVFHLAAQPLVRRSYHAPLATWSTNVMGTANLLEACRTVDGVKAVVVVTSDKCYENKESLQGYTESDRLGGYDPYSASKAAAELVVSSYRDAFFQSASAPLVATARAGNVIGGGDWSEDRLIPDIVRAYHAKTSLAVRNPRAVRPWQHVLESLYGYLLLGGKLLQGRRECTRGWNFGPAQADAQPVEALLSAFKGCWPDFTWHVSPEPLLHETQALTLDSTQAHSLLGWTPVWSLEQAIAATAGWYAAYMKDNCIESQSQLDAYIAAHGARNAA